MFTPWWLNLIWFLELTFISENTFHLFCIIMDSPDRCRKRLLCATLPGYQFMSRRGRTSILCVTPKNSTLTFKVIWIFFTGIAHRARPFRLFCISTALDLRMCCTCSADRMQVCRLQPCAYIAECMVTSSASERAVSHTVPYVASRLISASRRDGQAIRVSYTCVVAFI